MADKVLSSEEFFDLFSTEYKENKDNIKGVGRGKLKEDISALKLPKAALVKKEESDNSSKSCFGRGRGTARMNVLMSNQPARLPKVKGSTKGYVGLHNTSAFPSLQASAAGISKATHSTKKSHKQKTNQPSDFNSPWPSLEAYKQNEVPSRVPPSYSNSVSRNAEQINDNGDGGDVVVIRNLPEAILDEDLKELLSLYGNVLVCNIERDADGHSLGSALVRMETKPECEWIISCFHDQEYPGCSDTDKLCCTLLGQ